jgi:hypothetical protein
MSDRHLVGIVHVHSDYSHDSRDSLERLRGFAAERGISFVGLTEHAEDLDAERFNRYREHCLRASGDGVELIPGLEFRFAGYRGLHLLAIGLDTWIEPQTPAEFVALMGRRNAFTIVAHPRLADYQVPEAVAAGVHAVEVWNAAYDTRYLPDPAAIRLLQRLQARHRNLVGVAGLDQHDVANDRETRVLLRQPETDWLAALRGGRFENVGRTMRFDARVSWPGWRLGGLTAVRTVFDVVERTQDWVAHRAAARRRS